MRKGPHYCMCLLQQFQISAISAIKIVKSQCELKYFSSNSSKTKFSEVVCSLYITLYVGYISSRTEHQ